MRHIIKSSFIDVTAIYLTSIGLLSEPKVLIEKIIQNQIIRIHTTTTVSFEMQNLLVKNEMF